MQLKRWWILFIVSSIASSVSACSTLRPAHVAVVTTCVVDCKSDGYQCSENGERFLFLTKAEGKGLECLSPEDSETFFNSCHRGIVPLVTRKSIVGDLCASENYFCMEPKYWNRTLDRCFLNQASLK